MWPRIPWVLVKMQILIWGAWRGAAVVPDGLHFGQEELPPLLVGSGTILWMKMAKCRLWA